MQTVLLDQRQSFVLTPTFNTLYLVLLDQQAQSGTIKVELVLEQSGLNCQLLFLGRLRRNSNWQIESQVKHLATKTSCITEVYISQANYSQVDYFGRIHIAAHASRSKSLLKEQSLVLGQATYSRSRPVLEIFNNQVQASHSASSSRLDEADIFYLMSRGLLRVEAEQILEEAFFNKVLSSVKSVEGRTLISKYLKQG